MKRRFNFLLPWTRESLVLVLAGLLFVAQGLSLMFYTASAPRWEALVIARNVMPLNWWGLFFIVCGVVATVTSRWPAEAHHWGYIILTGLSSGLGQKTFLQSKTWTNQ